MYKIGIDIGGTFTDFVVYDDATGRVHAEKHLTTPAAPEQAVLAGLAALGDRLPGFAAGGDRLIHATTLVTNAILERKGAATALLTTEGFRDILETRREYRYNVYDLFIRFPDPIVPRHRRYGVAERIYSDGSVRLALDEQGLRAIAAELRAAAIQAIAVCFLHAYRNPAHEKRAMAILAEALPGVALSASHEVDPQPREYERCSTTVLDAYVKPVIDRYLSSLAASVAERGFAAPIEIMLSNGGTTTAAIARRFPVQMIESGPAAGVEAVIWLCRTLGIENALSFDMGGTTAKLCIVRGAQADRARDFEAGRVHRFVAGSGLPVSVPVYDLVEIGAGGGSLARLDHLGLLEVGPESAGADPGPACYGRGGRRPTVTDADLTLGLIDAEGFLGGDMRLDAAAGREALEREIAGPLGMTAAEAAWGVFDLVNEAMVSAARLHIAAKGCDPARLTVIAFGGAGPVHAIDLARKLGCGRVVFPPLAGVLSSLGLLTAPPAFERLATVTRLLDDCTPEIVAAAIAGLRGEVVAVMGEARAMSFRYVAEMQHRGQEYPIEVPFAEADLGEGWRARLREEFLAQYRQLYGRVDTEAPIELAALRVVGIRSGQTVTLLERQAETGARPAPRRRRVFDRRSGDFTEVEVVARADLAVGAPVAGPLAIQDRESGLVIRAGDRAVLHASGAVFVELAAP